MNDDLISRQDAIDALEREKTYCTAYKERYTPTDCFKQYNMGLTDGIKALNKLPSAQLDVPDTNVGDMISRQAVIDSVIPAMIDGADADMVEGLIHLLPSAQPEPQWIPCSERLPKEEKRHYWVCTDTGYQCQCRWTNDVYGLGASDRWEWKIFDIPQYQKVIAWMPLPEPYKEKEK